MTDLLASRSQSSGADSDGGFLLLPIQLVEIRILGVSARHD